MIRVLQVVGTMDLGGAETLIMNIYRNIDRSKVQFDFLCHNRIEAEYTDEIRALGGQMYCVPGISHVGPFRYQENLYRFFCGHPEYKTVHSHHDILSGMILYQAKRAGVPNRFSHAHNEYVSKKISEQILLAFFKPYFPKSVTHAFACAEIAGKTLYSGRLLKEYEIIPNVIETGNFRYSFVDKRSIWQELNIEEGPVIGHIGRFAEQKNHRFLIEIFEHILEKQKKARLVLIGQGKLQKEIETMVKERRIEEQVHFLGSRQDIPACLSAMDLFLFPSIREGLSVATIEAQASGVPVLTSDSVSSEVAVTDLVYQMSLREPAEEWAKKALELIGQSRLSGRRAYADAVKAAGFDAVDLAQKMQRFYLDAESKYSDKG